MFTPGGVDGPGLGVPVHVNLERTAPVAYDEMPDLVRRHFGG